MGKNIAETKRVKYDSEIAVALVFGTACILTIGEPDIIDRITGANELKNEKERIEFLSEDFNKVISQLDKLEAGKETDIAVGGKIFTVTRQP